MLSQSHLLLSQSELFPCFSPFTFILSPFQFLQPKLHPYGPISPSFPKFPSLFSRTRITSRPITSYNVSLSNSDEVADSSLEDFDLDRFAHVANLLADAAGGVIRQYFRKRFDIVHKEDLSPVTVADKLAEEAMVTIIQENFPSHGIKEFHQNPATAFVDYRCSTMLNSFGEENGWRSDKDEVDYVWVLDPIDGTKSFITGKPLFGTLIALLHKGKPILGIIDQPILRERWVGLSGRRTTLNGQEISTRRCEELSQAYLYTTSPHLFSGDAEMAFARIREKVKMPLYGCDCYAYALLATGFVDLVIESGLKPYDFFALVPVIEGAGGSITDWKGDELNWQPSADSRPTSFNVAAAGDKQIHLQSLHVLQWH